MAESDCCTSAPPPGVVAHPSQSVEAARQLITATMKSVQRSRYITAAFVVVVTPIITLTVVRYTDLRREHATDTLAYEEKP